MENGAQAGEIRPVQAVAVDVGRRDDADGDPLGAADDRAKELFPHLRGDLLRVVQ